MPTKAQKTKYHPLLKTALLKVTKERLSILSTLEKSKKPLSVKDLKTKVGDGKMDQTTIYRNMELLREAGLIRLVNFQHDHNHYELVSPDHHHHLICENCGKVVDVSKCDTSKLEKEVLTIGGFARINSHALEFFGTCKTCVTKNKTHP